MKKHSKNLEKPKHVFIIKKNKILASERSVNKINNFNDFFELLIFVLFSTQELNMKGIEMQHHSMVITLDETDSNQIPEEAWEATAITELKIQKTQPASQWKTCPPLSWYETRDIEPPYWTLSDNIGKLVNLKSLYLTDLDLKSLPASIVQLQKLETLNVSLNKLDLSNELEKFKKLKKLRHLILLGNHFDEAIMLAFKNEFKGLKVEYRDEDEQSNTTDGINTP